MTLTHNRALLDYRMAQRAKCAPEVPSSLRALIFVLLGVWALTVCSIARAAQMGADSFVVRRSPAATDCPGEAAIRAELRKLSPAPKPEDVPSLHIAVRLDRYADRYRAELDVSGRRHGKRSLEAAGPSCEALARALVVALAILLDLEIPQAPSETSSKRARSEDSVSVPQSDTGRPENERDEPWARLGVSAGVAGTWDLPHELSLLTRAGIVLRGSAWAFSIAGLWVLPRQIPHGPGEVEVSLLGGEVRACFGALALSRTVELMPCGVAEFARLEGEGSGFAATRRSLRPWIATGLEARLTGGIGQRLFWSSAATLLAPLNRERFHVDGVSGSAFTSAPVAGSLGAELGLLLW